MPHGHQRSTGRKAVFDDIYVSPDPRAYFRVLGAHDYEVPTHGATVFAAALEALDLVQPTVLDVCSSYGINGALLKYDVELDELHARYTGRELADATTRELIESDRAFLQTRRRDGAPRVVGLDSSAPAITYAVAAGLIDHGHAVDLERHRAGRDLRATMAAVDMITVTGGVGYVTARTFDRLLDARGDATPPWIATLCLRSVPYGPVVERLAARGLVTEKLEGVTFPQRRFVDETEQSYALARLAELEVDPAGCESEGRYHVEVFLSRPPQDASACPIEELLSGVDAHSR